MVKQIVKRYLPARVSTFVTRVRTDRRQKQYGRMDLAATFEQIYRTGEWDTVNDGALNSGIGSRGRYVEEYFTLLRAELLRHNVRSVADLGCGDFTIGRLIASLVPYVGVDIAQAVIDRNVRTHSSERVRFVRADLTRDALPDADAAIVRQVLQHLGNAEVKAALQNVLGSYRLAIVTEHVYIGPGARPNVDIDHGPATRVPKYSGVFIDQPPFSIPADHACDIQYAPDEVLRTWIVSKL